MKVGFFFFFFLSFSVRMKEEEGWQLMHIF